MAIAAVDASMITISVLLVASMLMYRSGHVPDTEKSEVRHPADLLKMMVLRGEVGVHPLQY